MKVFVAGATGAVGRPLVRQLVAAGHQVVGSTRTSQRFDVISELGAEPVAMDGLNGQQVQAAVLGAAPEVVIHQLSGLAKMGSPKHFDREFATTNRLRTEGLDLLLAAAREAGARRFIAQSYTGWPNERSGSAVKAESDPLDPSPTRQSVQTLAAIRYLERTVTTAGPLEGIALRYGALYGPGTSLAPGGDLWEGVRHRKLPIVGTGAGIFSFIHVEDAAAATVLAAEDGGDGIHGGIHGDSGLRGDSGLHGDSGIYNVVDDEPAPASEWLTYLADLLGVKRPRRIPAWLAAPLAGTHLVSMMTVCRGSSNGKARRELGFSPRYPSWREGFRAMLADAPAAREHR